METWINHKWWESHCSNWQKTVKYHNESISACGTPFYLNASTVPMGDDFPIELGFWITIPKAQGQTTDKFFASLSEPLVLF